MNILFIDSNIERHNFYCLKKHSVNPPIICHHGDYRVYHAVTIDQSLVYLDSESFDVVYVGLETILGADKLLDTLCRYGSVPAYVVLHCPKSDVACYYAEMCAHKGLACLISPSPIL